MRIRTIIALAAALGAAVPGARAQLRSVGEMPADLRQSVQELYDTSLTRAKEYVGGRVRDRQQLLESAYHINKMLSWGHIVYGDPISAMVERIADTLLHGYPELRRELRFYTVTSADVNAFATPQGMVFVNTGLVAQVEDEAQLAFILSHEIVHYYRSHGMEELVGKRGRRQEADIDDEAERGDELTRYHNRSREMESEADSLGIAMFYLGSAYDKGVGEGVFDVLQYSALPFDEVAFDTTWFDTPLFTLGGCWLAEVADITSRDNYDDSRSTHPNILRRRQRAAAMLDGHRGGSRYVTTSKEEFVRLQRMAREECIRQDLLHGNYCRAFYNSWILGERKTESGKRKDENGALERYMVQALYGMATFKNNGRENEVIGDYKKVEGESQQVYHAMRKMTAEQLTLVALHKAWEAHLHHPEEGYYTAVAEDLMEQLRTKVGKASTDYLAEGGERKTENGKMKTENIDADNAGNEPKTKYERIKQKRQEQTQRTPTAYALTDLMQRDPALQPLLRSHLNGTATRPAATGATKDSAATIVFNPSYWVVSTANDEMKVGQSVDKERRLGERVARMAERFGHRAVDFSDNAMHGMTEEGQYNDFLTICEWMNEFWLSKGKFDMQRVMQPQMDDLLDRYGARTIDMTAVLNTTGNARWGNLAYALVVPLAPVVAAAVANDNERTAMVSLMVDAREGKLLTRQAYGGDMADDQAAIDAMLYDTYRQAMRPAKKEPVGHMGHRVALTVGAAVGPSGSQPMDQLKKYAALMPWAAVEFAVGRQASIYATARYQGGYDEVTQTVEEWEPYYHMHQEPSSMDMLTVGLGARIYLESEFAPMGLYASGGGLWVRYSASEGHLYTSDNGFGISVGLGKNFILMDRLVINYEVDYAWVAGYLSDKWNHFDAYEYVGKEHRADGLVSNLVTLRVGIGVIPF